MLPLLQVWTHARLAHANMARCARPLEVQLNVTVLLHRASQDLFVMRVRISVCTWMCVLKLTCSLLQMSTSAPSLAYRLTARVMS